MNYYNLKKNKIKKYIEIIIIKCKIKKVKV